MGDIRYGGRDDGIRSRPSIQPKTVSEIPWTGVIAVEGVDSTDGRHVEPGALTWSELPLPVMHDERLVGRVDKITRDGSLIRASGVLFEIIQERTLAVTVDAIEVFPVGDGLSRMYFRAARIRNVFIGTDSIWPQCRIDEAA
jgi:hypothetical protein